ncbi:SPOR domain-containing protein [Vibrio sp. SCSIO 43135]|uniref:SPOR domain-containing protein n=1 Tax=Vibrio sp. SCSIO 43135 TaxID=2819096 RepID=UPI00207597CF|nr:SPOR domain-containing protein [Vibrio sp. SCSIO 43135]USD41071.1 SPOR domain-containing protein [Vibrio sp. SCSIO 43135]
MDSKMAAKSITALTKLLSVAVLALPAISSPAMAEEFLCDATQASTSQLPVLDKSCPIGKGLWGKQQPKGQESVFWIQCGVYSKPLPLAKAAKLYEKISVDVWAKPEAKGYRCLIGPYNEFAKASTELRKVKKVSGYKEAFIREVVKGTKAKPQVAMESKPAAKVVAAKPATKPSASKTNKAEPTKTAATKAPVANPQSAPVAKALPVVGADKPSNDIDIRLSTTVSGLKYAVPYKMMHKEFYMEHSLPWNRMNYQTASKTCSSLAMRLPVEAEWKQLLESKVMETEKWPMHLPYWGFAKKGLFTSGKISQLKGTSLLNVICVK